MKIFKNFLSITLVLILGITQNLSAQSLKKTFKYLEKDDFEKANIEIQKLSANDFKTNEDIVIYYIAKSVMFNSKAYQRYNPYTALELFSEVSKRNANSTEVDKFLAKYNLSIDKVNNSIFQNILSKAKDRNSEASYQKALDVCQECFYKDEVIRLKESIAYKEAKSKESIDGYKYFISAYPTSEKLNEIRILLYEAAFLNAKSKLTVISMDNYLNKYSNNDNKLLSSAKHFRDSLAFSKVKKTYSEHLEFVNKYPNSKYTTRIKNGLLADLLYKQAKNGNSLNDLKLFISQYPNDSRIGIIENKLEELYVEKLKNEMSLVEFDAFKKRYPNSTYLGELNGIYSRIIANNDLKRDGLNGAIKSIETTGYKYNNRNIKEIRFIIKKEYNDFGKIIQIKAAGSYDDPLKLPFEINRNILGEDKWVRFSSLSIVESPLYYFNVGQVGYNQSFGTIDFKYNNHGLLIQVEGKNGRNKLTWKFIYDSNDNLITKDILINRSLLLYKIKYGREIDHSYKYIYYANGDLYRQFEHWNYGGIESIIEKNERKKIEYRTTIERDGRYLIVKRLIESNLDDNDVYCANREITYEYDENEKLCSKDVKSKWKEYAYGNRNNPKIWGRQNTSSMSIKWDSHGQIISNSPNNEYEYKYDSYGNWIERTEYKVITNDITIKTKESVIKRTITYY